MARRWCWRQSAEGATGPDTTAALFVVEAHHENAAADVDAALDETDRPPGCSPTRTRGRTRHAVPIRSSPAMALTQPPPGGSGQHGGLWR